MTETDEAGEPLTPISFKTAVADALSSI